MDITTNKTVLTGDYSNKNFQKASFKNEDLANSNFTGSDLRGADFSGSNLTGADFSRARTGITPANTALIFFVALAVSILSGYFAMLTGQTIQGMIGSGDPKIRAAGILAIVLNVFFIVFAWRKGGRNAITHLILPAIVLAMVMGVVGRLSGLGSGIGGLYLSLSFFFLLIMFIIGTVARTAAGTVSNILFVGVAISGALFGKSIGGGAAATVMAIGCALISKRALSNTKGFDFLKGIACSITKTFGTSFRNSKLTGAIFSSKIKNADFTNADLSWVSWHDSKKFNCIPDTEMTVVRSADKKGDTLH